MAKRDFNKKQVMISGAAGGLGTGLCEVFGKAGAKIIALDISESRLATLKERMSSQGIDIITHRCDITRESECRKVVAHFSKIDLLINNAGITKIKPFTEEEIEDVCHIMEVNFYGSLFITAAALSRLKRNKGMIITISSIAGFSPLYGRTGYAASKYALHGFFETLRSELIEDEVAVMMVSPSFVDTGIGETKENPKKKIGKVASPLEVAQQIFKAAEKEKRHLITGRVGKMAWWLHKFSPKTFERLMLKKIKEQ